VTAALLVEMVVVRDSGAARSALLKTARAKGVFKSAPWSCKTFGLHSRTRKNPLLKHQLIGSTGIYALITL
jgi:hypothetical protein